MSKPFSEMDIVRTLLGIEQLPSDDPQTLQFAYNLFMSAVHHVSLFPWLASALQSEGVETTLESAIFFFIKKRVNPNPDILDDPSGTLLHLLVRQNKLDVVQTLLRYVKGDVNKPNVSGIVPMCIAVSANNRAMVKVLYQAGAQLAGPGWRGDTAISLAITSQALSVLQFFDEQGIDVVNYPHPKPDVTSITLAVHHDGGDQANLPILEFLLRRGANPNQMYHGTSMATFAARINQWNTLRCLIQFGAEVDCVARDGTTLLYPSHLKMRTKQSPGVENYH